MAVFTVEKSKRLIVIKIDVSAFPIWCWSLGGFLESYWSLVYVEILKELDSNTVEGIPMG